MERQLSLLDARDRSIQEQFDSFHRDHPEVFGLFRDFASSLWEAGHQRYSADAILHRIRWHQHVERGDRDFAINNNFASRYARKLASEDERFRDFFEFRRLKTD